MKGRLCLKTTKLKVFQEGKLCHRIIILLLFHVRKSDHKYKKNGSDKSFLWSSLFCLWCGWNAFSAVVNFPPVSVEGVLAQLSHHMWEVMEDPIVDNLAVDHLPEVHVADLNPLSGGCDSHELSGMVCLLSPEGSCPLPHEEPRFVNAHLVRESSLKGI